MAKSKKIDLLLKKGIITEDQLARTQEEVNKTGMPIEKALEKLGFVSEIDIAQIMAESIGVPFIDLTDYLIDSEVVKLVPESTAKKYKAIPLFKIGDSITVAMEDPQDIMAIDEIRVKSKVGVIEAVLSTPDMIQRAINQYYGSLGSVEELVKGLTEEKLEKKGKKDKDPGEDIEDLSVIKLANLLITQAVKDRASDIHIEPEANGVRIRYRIDGILHEMEVLPKRLQSALVSRVKVMSGMDIAETRNPQDGRVQLKMQGKDLDLRVSTFPTIHGENLVLRILDKAAVLLGLGDIGFSANDLTNFEKIIRSPNGIFLVCGPTGSGKTTTLYSALSTINSIEKNIITIEDPVEYEIPLIRQTQVNVKAGLTFASGLRSILRQDPDIVMVGEIRDKETADTAIQASLTGHLVFSTLHTNDASSALTRIIDMGIEPFLISSSIIGILAQRLVRVICPKCKEQYSPSEEILQKLNIAEKRDFHRGKGCLNCRQTGFVGRRGIFELLIIDDKIKDMILAKSSANEIKKVAVGSGMCTLFENGIEKIKEGITTIEEIARVSESEN